MSSFEVIPLVWFVRVTIATIFAILSMIILAAWLIFIAHKTDAPSDNSQRSKIDSEIELGKIARFSKPIH